MIALTRSNMVKGLVGFAALLSVSFNDNAAQAAPEMRQKGLYSVTQLFGKPVVARCAKVFGNQSTGEEGDYSAFIDGLDKYVFHDGADGTIAIFTSDKSVRDTKISEIWNPALKAKYEDFAQRYDNAQTDSDRIKVLQEILISLHPDAFSAFKRGNGAGFFETLEKDCTL